MLSRFNFFKKPASKITFFSSKVKGKMGINKLKSKLLEKKIKYGKIRINNFRFLILDL